MTFLEFVCRELLGPPEGRDGDSPTWPCPECDHRSFHVRPPHPRHKDRFGCYRCDFWGDAADLLKYLFPEDDYGQRLERLDALRAEYDRSGASKPPAPAPAAGRAGISSRGSGSSPAAEYPYDPDGPAVAFAALSKHERKLLAEAFALADRHKVPVEPLARYCADFAEFLRTTDADHRAECTDPDCTARVCRAARGEVLNPTESVGGP